ncbi:MAG: acetamidase/formamidase family protein [Armatimonadota bacterium]|nr:acetamidase/formamidase family protein [Armatimonadota bacterium]
MRRLTADHFVHEMSELHSSAYTIGDGETVVIETLDCDGGMRARDGLVRSWPTRPNPATGPVEVEGCRPGEALAVTVHQIQPADWGFISGGGGRERATVIEIKDGAAIYPWGLRLPVNPVIGVIGAAPSGEPVPTNIPGDHGGNLDTADVCAGATVYLPVAVSGGMLALGDVHALQGDSECCGTGIECAAEVTLTARRVKDPLWPSVYLVRDDRLMVFAHCDTVDEAAWGAVAAMAQLLTKLTGLSDVESRRLLSTAGEVRISQIVNPKKTCRAIIPKHAIPEDWPF